MFNSLLRMIVAMVPVLAGNALAQEPDARIAKGAVAYRMCAACHSLHPGVHLSGPSLAGLWGRKAGSDMGFGRYTEALKASGIVWDEDTLDAWLADPSAMVAGTTMIFRGIEDEEDRARLVAFLGDATIEGGAAKVVEAGLIPESIAEGQIPPSLNDVTADQLVTEIRHCGDAYHVTTESGAGYPFWETNVRLKIDTSERGPVPGKVVLLRSGMAGDRVSVVFSSLAALHELLVERC